MRDSNGRFARSKKWLTIVTLIAVCIVLADIHFGWVASFVAPTAQADNGEVERLAKVEAGRLVQEKITGLENVVLADLANCESGGTKDPNGVIIFDTNNKASIGRYQWQRESVIHYYNVLHGKKISQAEAIAIAIDPVKATELTRAVLFETEKGYTNWLICSKRNNIAERVKIINSL